jgi:protein disulfide-isomerase A6
MQIQGYPTIKFFGDAKNSSIEYIGERNAEAIVKFALDKLRDITNKRLSGKSQSSSKSSSESKKESSTSGDKDVVVLTEDNFDETVLKSKDMWLVDFFAPWCGHCKRLEPEWNKAATDLKGKVKVGKVDATVHQRLAGKYGIQGYPTIKVFPAGDKKGKVEKYEGPRDASAIAAFALEKLEKYGIVPDVEQLTNENQFKELCKDRTGVCIISFLPHIMDSSAEKRKSYIDELKAATKSAKGKPIYYLWAQGGDFFDLEDKLHLSFGYPAVVAVNFGKKKYSVCRSAFGEENIKSFVNSIFNK